MKNVNLDFDGTLLEGQMNMVIPTLEETVTRMQAEVMTDIRAGIVDRRCKSFSDLHDYVDANCYGGFCDDALADALIAHFGGRDEHEGMPQGMLDYMNTAQNRIDLWIKEGGIYK